MLAPIRLSQKEQILSYLNQHDDDGRLRGISPLEAIGLFRCYRLASRIRELREDGYDIITKKRTDATGKTYGRYFLNLAPARPVRRLRK